jgi:hypothetical protein
MTLKRWLGRMRRDIVLERDLFKLSLLRYRRFDGYFASMHQAGNHWLRHIFGLILAHEYGVPEPSHINDLRVIGGILNTTQIAGIPVLAFSHRIPSRLVHSAPFRVALRFPRTVLIVRDLRAALVSNYERFKDQYGVSFSEYVRGDLNGRRFNCDIWDCIRFLNAWGRVLANLPERTTVVRYETLKERTVDEVHRLWRFLALPAVDRSVVEAAVAGSSKERMSAKEEGSGKERVIRMNDRHPQEWFTPADQQYLIEVCRDHLRYDFGYTYQDWTSARAA